MLQVSVHQGLVHPNIVNYLTSKITTDAVFIFMELANGGELFDRIGRGLEFLDFLLLRILLRSADSC
jgi:serine/threonine protein kinase